MLLHAVENDEHIEVFVVPAQYEALLLGGDARPFGEAVEVKEKSDDDDKEDTRKDKGQLKGLVEAHPAVAEAKEGNQGC